MATFSQGGTLGTAIETSEIVDAAITEAKLGAALAAAAIPTVLTVQPLPNSMLMGIANRSVVTNTVMRLGQVVIPYRITVNKVSLVCNGVTAAGTFKVALYNEAGTTRLFTGTTGSYSTNYSLNTITLGAPVVVDAGIYYFAILPVDTANVDFPMWDGDDSVGQQLVLSVVSGEPVTVGKLTVTANTIPTTIDPTAITAEADNTPLFRLDN